MGGGETYSVAQFCLKSDNDGQVSLIFLIDGTCVMEMPRKHTILRNLAEHLVMAILTYLTRMMSSCGWACCTIVSRGVAIFASNASPSTQSSHSCSSMCLRRENAFCHLKDTHKSSLSAVIWQDVVALHGKNTQKSEKSASSLS